MAKPRVTVTDRLSNVIEVVELGRRTGLLLVERGTGTLVEEGAVYFVAGRAIFATLASLRGREALGVLARWGDCRFAFDINAPRPAPNITTPDLSAERSPYSSGGYLSRPSPSLSQYDGPYSSAPSLSGSTSGFWNLPSEGVAPPATGYGPAGAPYPNTGGLSNTGGFTGSAAPAYPGRGTGDLSQQTSHMLGRRPRRAPDVRDLMSVVTAYNLSRTHRSLLLLADGEHTVLDMARLSSKSPNEVAQLLTELEGYGLVYFYG